MNVLWSFTSRRFLIPLRILLRRYQVSPNLEKSFFSPIPRQPSLIPFQTMCHSLSPSKEISFEEFVDKKDDALVIDVRQPSELHESGKIPGSVNIPLKELEFALQSLSEEEFMIKYGIEKPLKQDPLIFHCRSGARSIQALAVALKLGFVNAVHYKGGFLDWESNSGETESV